ncbi:MAG: hydantoinase B/oxoprolinase family protein [Rhodospirillaceae bacterium]|jgi:N-methylhydantoinase B|nr:hydantoinase B/oxoprolinase family protein [Rhodospirillaceae bacterium]MBT5812044.1 hydantoinase B/oxoprolinase family protein [Rhodospirillaceae bacterium]
MTTAIDPITTSVIQHRLTGIVEEMGEAMLRTSYSQILNSSRDFSMALCGVDGGLLAQAEHIPVHVGAMSWAAREVIDYFEDQVFPGDVFLLNDPYYGGSHLPDVTVIVPVFVDGACMFWTLNRAHHSDIGGATHGAYNAAATEIWQEGLRIPPVKLYDKGVRRDDFHRMLTINVRHPRDFEGDLAAQIGSVKLGEKRLGELVAESGVETVSAAAARILDAAEAQARAVIKTWTDGVYKGVALLDDDGRGNIDIAVRATVTIKGDSIEVDLSESDPQVESFINSSFANTQSAVVMSYAFLLDPGIAQNAGTIRPLTVKAKEGTVVWAKPGAPVTLCTSHCSQEIIEAIVDAIAPACPERAMAGWGKRFRIAIKGEDPRNGAPFIWHMFHARPGGGASSGGDGWHGSGEWHSAGGLKFGSVEVAEARFPLLFERHEYRPESGGDGQYVGGAGCELSLRLETETDCKVNTAGEGVRHAAEGRQGGCAAAPHDYSMRAPDGTVRVLKTKEEGVDVKAGSVFEVLSGGGGGWGDPTNRTAEARAEDERDGLPPYTGGAANV